MIVFLHPLGALIKGVELVLRLHQVREQLLLWVEVLALRVLLVEQVGHAVAARVQGLVRALERVRAVRLHEDLLLRST